MAAVSPGSLEEDFVFPGSREEADLLFEFLAGSLDLDVHDPRLEKVFQLSEFITQAYLTQRALFITHAILTTINANLGFLSVARQAALQRVLVEASSLYTPPYTPPTSNFPGPAHSSIR